MANPPVFGTPIPVVDLTETNEEEIDRLQSDIIALRGRNDELESEIENLQWEQWRVSDEIIKLEEELSVLEASEALVVTPQGLSVYRATCQACSFDIETYGRDSLTFRAETHCFETGHEVAMLSAGDVMPFDRPMRRLAMPMPGWPS